MPWFKVDDGFHGHPKVIELSLTAVGLWTLAGSWSANYLTDGSISIKSISRLGGGESDANELVDAGLWVSNGGGWFQFKDWDDYQPLKADVEAEREAAQKRMRAIRAKRKGVQENSPDGSGDVQANTTETFEGGSHEVRTPRPSPPPIPIPAQPSPDSSPAHEARPYTDEFESVYGIYPVKAAKGAAFKAFQKAKKQVSVDVITDAVVRYRDDPNRESAFTKHFSTWLNQGCWDDDPLPSRNTQQGKPTVADKMRNTLALDLDTPPQQPNLRMISNDR